MSSVGGGAAIDVEAAGAATVIGDRSLRMCWCCDQPHRHLPIAVDSVARCVRCDAVLARGHRLTLESLLALTLAAGLLFVIAQLTPMVTVRLASSQTVASFPAAVWQAWRHGETLVALIAGATAIGVPAALIALRLYLLVPLVASGRRAPGYIELLRLLQHLSRWSMVEVLTVSALVSIVRVASLAQAVPGPGLIAVCAMTLVLAAMQSAGLRLLWDSAE